MAEPPRSAIGHRLRSLFNGRSTISDSSPSVLSTKSPAPRLGLSILASPTIDLSGLPTHQSPYSRSQFSPRSSHGVISPNDLTSNLPSSAQPARFAALPLSPPPVRTRRSSPQAAWEGEHVRERSGQTRRRRRKARKNARPHSNKKRLLRQGPGRMKLFRCVGLGLVLGVGLTVYLALALSGVIQGLNIHIFMIVVGLLLIMAFAHATVRLCMYILHPPEYPISRATSRAAVAPEEPIPVILRRDEEEFADDDEAGVPKDAVLPVPPPAYGLWRGSTRMDPNLIHWRRLETLRREERLPAASSGGQEQSSENRPPSYASEDGVRHVLDNQLRSVASEAESPPLPIHPSERGRVPLGI